MRFTTTLSLLALASTSLARPVPIPHHSIHPARAALHRRAEFTLSNGEAAQKLNRDFQSLTADSACTDGDNGCIGDAFAQCANGKFAISPCAGGTKCFGLPLVNKPGTAVTCDTETDALARIDATGAAGGIFGDGGAGASDTSAADNGSANDASSDDASSQDDGSEDDSSDDASTDDASSQDDESEDDSSDDASSIDASSEDDQSEDDSSDDSQDDSGDESGDDSSTDESDVEAVDCSGSDDSNDDDSQDESSADDQSAGSVDDSQDASVDDQSDTADEDVVTEIVTVTATPDSNNAGANLIAGGPTSTSTADAAASTSDGAAGSSDFKRQNALDAQALNRSFASIEAGADCEGTQSLCSKSGDFIQCANGKLVASPCASGLTCMALPLVLKPGTTISCDTEADGQARMAAAGASASLT